MQRRNRISIVVSLVLVTAVTWNETATSDEPKQVAEDFLDWIFESPTGKNNASSSDSEGVPGADITSPPEAELMTDVPVQEDNFSVDELLGSSPENNEPAIAKKSNEKLDIQTDYKSALSLAQLHQRPILVLFGAEWCTWCRQLEKELSKPEADVILRNWIIAKVDVDQNAEIAQKMSVSSLPALRILSTDQSVIDRQEGFMPLEELQAWLDSKQADADPAIQKILYDTNRISAKELPILIGFLGNRSPELRRAASQRVTSARSDCAGAVVDALRSGSLAQKLSAFDILTTWRAPLQGIDPWQPASISEQTVTPLIEWLRNHADEFSDSGSHPGQAAFTDELLSSVMVKFLSKASEQPAAAFSEAVRYGNALVPHIRQRIAVAELPDSERSLLRELLYRVLAGERTRLQHSSLLSALASSDSQTHRDAAQRLLENTTSQDQPLIDEMSQDVDALVREMTIPKLQAIGALQSEDRRLRLLRDKSPSVRTAVLRELSENPDAGAIASLVTYLQSETDEDLLVYAAKTLGQLGSHKEAEDALSKMVGNASWRVRAAALDAIDEMIESTRYSYRSDARKLSSDVTTAVMNATEDSDAFVAERAATLLPKTVTEESAENIVQYLFANPGKVSKFEQEVGSNHNEESRSPLVSVAMKSLKSDDIGTVRTAAMIVGKLSPFALKDELPMLLKSSDGDIRLTAMRAMLANLNAHRDRSVNELTSSVAADNSELQPWFDVPKELVLTRKRNSKSTSEIGLSSSKSIGNAVEPATTSHELSVLDDFFGSATADKTSIDQPPIGQIDQPKTEEAASELDALAGFFGENLSEAETKPPTEQLAEDSTRNAETESELETSKPADARDSTALAGLPSSWLNEWQTNSEKTEWMQGWEASFAEVPTDARTAAELQLIHLINLATGNLESTKLVIQDINSLPRDKEDENLLVQNALPWLPAEDRLNSLKSRTIDWSNITDEKVGQLLQAATVIDDLAIADYVLQGIPSTPTLDDKKAALFRSLVTRGLLGMSGDQLSQYIYPASYNSGEDENAPFGRKRAWEWLHKNFQTIVDDNERAILILTAPYIDYSAGIETSVGFVAQATEYSLTLKFATVAALCSDPSESAHRATQWLTHPVSEVRKYALQRLISSPYEFAQAWYSLDVRLQYEYDIKMPPFWLETDLLDAPRLELALSMADSDLQRLHLKVLQQSIGVTIDLNDFSSADISTKLHLVGALAKSQRLDNEAVNFISSVADTLDQGQAAKYYAFVKSLKNDRVAAVRKSLRDKHGASILEL